jgi:hypothetical protein
MIPNSGQQFPERITLKQRRHPRVAARLGNDLGDARNEQR